MKVEIVAQNSEWQELIKIFTEPIDMGLNESYWLLVCLNLHFSLSHEKLARVK